MKTILIVLLLSQITLVAINGLHLWAEYEYGHRRPMAAAAIYRWEDKYLFTQAMIDIKAGQHRWAVKDLSGVIARSPYHIDAINDLGVAHWLLNDHREAERWFRRALEMAPEYPWARQNLEILQGKRKGDMNIMVLGK